MTRVLRVVAAIVLAIGGLTAVSAGSASAAPVWSIVASPSPAQSELSAVACPSTTMCMAVGSKVAPDGRVMTLAERRTGAGWVVVATPNAPGAQSNSLRGVACPTVASCFAVGLSYSSAGSSNARMLIEHWNGTTWSVMTNPDHISGSAQLNGVACVNATLCYAVGQDAHAVVVRFAGGKWTERSTPDAPDTLLGVSCVSASDCTAVGRHGPPPDEDTVTKTSAVHWNGTVWSETATPNPVGAHTSLLQGVTCRNATLCFAVGLSDDHTLVERWNGKKWFIYVSPNRAGPGNALTAVSCPAVSPCVAVGGSGLAPSTKTLVETWNGANWSIMASPTPTSRAAALAGIACVSTVQCVAVGSSQTPTSQFTLVERYG
jgi:hypothetical protein